MSDWGTLGKWLLVLGGGIALLGLLVLLLSKVPWLGRLPGDMRIEREGFSCYIPIVTMILLSLVLTLLLNLVIRLLK